MSFLDEFDKRAKQPQPPDPNQPRSEDDDLLDFADLIRSRQAMPSAAERERILARVKNAGAPKPAAPAKALPSFWWIYAAAALFMAALMLATLMPKAPAKPGGDTLAVNSVSEPKEEAVQDEFAHAEFPQPVRTAPAENRDAEVSSDNTLARTLRVHGLVVYQNKGETRWRMLKRGVALRQGDLVRASLRLDSGARILSPDGSAVSIGPGGLLRHDGPRSWKLDAGAAYFEVASRKDLPAFNVTTPDGGATALGTRFVVRVNPRNEHEPKKNATFCRVDDGRVEIAARNAQVKTLNANDAAFLNTEGIVMSDDKGGLAWMAALENEMNSDHGIGQLVAKTEHANEHLPLEIASHHVTVTCVDQVARTFVDESFANNTDRRLEGTFYYPLPADAAIGEFAMFVDGKRIVGEVLEQQKARQVFEYIVRQQKDPALLEWAGGNLFKMRVYPIEPHSAKRIQLGYTQILPRRSGTVTYTYPLFSEMLLKNPLLDLAIEFRVLSSAGMSELSSPTHACATALDERNGRGTLAFSAKNYAPTRDFSATYKVPDTAECIAAANVHADEPDPFFMLQLEPKVELPARKPPERLLVIVDGSASAGAQDYAVAAEFAASCADVSSNWAFGLLRGGQTPEECLFESQAQPPGASRLEFALPETSKAVRNFLNAKPALGATDLLATFAKAADYANDGKGLQIVYIGDGVDTVSELSGPALVEHIAALFKGKNAQLSTVAIGSSYERTVLQGLAGRLGGTFTRVEGAADVHAAVDQVFDSFYRPQLWNARVKLEGVETNNVHAEFIGTLAAGDTAIVLGRFKSSAPKDAAPANVQARVLFSAEADGNKIERVYPLQLAADTAHNQFLPRLWARAHQEALMAALGLGSADNDGRIKNEITADSVKYQIMSPFTSFLVLESEEDYAKYGIKRTMKRVDWMPAKPMPPQSNAPSNSLRRKSNSNEWAERGQWGDDPAESGGEVFLFDAAEAWVQSTNSPMAQPVGGTFSGNLSLDEDAKDLFFTRSADFDGSMPAKAWLGLDQNALLGDLGDIRREGDVSSLDNLSYFDNEIPDADEMAFSDRKSGSNFANFSMEQTAYINRNEFKKAMRSRDGFSGGYARLGRSAYNSYSYSQALAFPALLKVTLQNADAKPLEFKIDQPLKSVHAYQTIVVRDPADLGARLHWVLALQTLEQYTKALEELSPLLEIYPRSVELHLYKGELLVRGGELKRGLDAFDGAFELAPEKDKRALNEKITALLSSLGQYELAGERYAKFALTAVTAEQAAEHGNNAVNAWQNARQLAKCGPLWEALAKRWPDSAAVKAGMAHWLLWGKPKGPDKGADAQTRALDLYKDAAAQQESFAPDYVTALMHAKRYDQARTEAARLNNSATTELKITVVLNALSVEHNGIFSRNEAKRLLRGNFSAAQYRAAAQYWSIYSTRTDKEFAKLLLDGLSNEKLTPAARFFAAAQLARSNVPGMTAEKMFAQLKQNLDGLKTQADFSLAQAAAQLLLEQKKSREALELSEGLLKITALTDDWRAAFLGVEFQALNALGRNTEFHARHGADLFGEKAAWNENLTTSVVGVILAQQLQGGAFDGAMRTLIAAEKRFPDSLSLDRRHSDFVRAINQLKTPEARAAALELCAKLEPANPLFAEMRARGLAQQGKLREAAELVRDTLKVVPRSRVGSFVRSARPALIQLLAQLSARDAGMRDTFLKEAGENSKTQDPVWREWTEGMLTCLHAAGDVEAYIGALSVRAAEEPNDPEWAPRLGAALMEAGRFKKAGAIFEGLSNADPNDPDLAFIARQVFLLQKDQTAAQKFFERAFTALAAHPNRLNQAANGWQNSNPEWALKAYERLARDPKFQGMNHMALFAGNAARALGRTNEAIDWYFQALLDENSTYLASALSELTVLAQQETWHSLISARATAELLGQPGASKQIAAHLLLYKLKRLKAEPDAQQELEAALAVKPSEHNFSSATAALAEALAEEKNMDRLETYALEGGGDLNDNDRKQLIRSALNHFHNAKDGLGAIRLYRKLLEEPDYNCEEDRRQLCERLIQNGELDAALSEVRKFDPGPNSWGAWHSWQRLIDAYKSKQDWTRAAETAWEAFEQFKDDQSYGGNVQRELVDTAAAAQRANKLDAKIEAWVLAAYRERAVEFFKGNEEWRSDSYSIENTLKTLDLLVEFDAMAKAAEESGQIQRINAAAKYMERTSRYNEARKIWARALALEPNNREALEHGYRTNQQQPADWPLSFNLLERLTALGGADEIWLKTERIRCLTQLGRHDEAREVFHTLAKDSRFLQRGHWAMQELARQCEAAKDFSLAVEIWEMAIRYASAQKRGKIASSDAAQLYTACGKAYAAKGEEGKALDCFLRGMSVIPRNESYYKNVLQAALETVLKGSTLDQAVATHENKVQTEGGDKPHLRIAFAEAYKKQNQTREMLGQLSIAANLLPKDMTLRKEVIDGYKQLGDAGAALDSYQAWSKLDPQNIELYRGWGELYESLGRRNEALLAWATMAEMRPREAEGYAAYAKKLVELGLREKASVALRQAVKYRPTEFDIAEKLARVYRQLESNKEGEERIARLWSAGESACRKATEDLPDDPAPWLNLGQFLIAQKKDKEATELYEKIALRQWPRFQRETVDQARKQIESLKKPN